MNTRVIVFPFDLFGSGGTGEGAHLLAEGVREILKDTRRETTPTRAHTYGDKVRLRQATFETIEALTTWRHQGRKWARRVLSEGDFLIWLGGNHLSALPVYDVLAGQEGTLVVQLDAHLDIHHFHDTTTELSHGNFLLHARQPLPPLVNVGHRHYVSPDILCRRPGRGFAGGPDHSAYPRQPGRTRVHRH
jgi:arginase family enzyme